MDENATTIGEETRFFHQFLAELQAQGRRESTLRAYETDWQHYASWYHQTKARPFALEHLQASDIKDYLGWAQVQGLKLTTINRRLTFLKHYAAWAEKRGSMEAEQRQHIKQIPMLKKQPSAPQALTSEQVQDLLGEVERRATVRDAAVIYTLLFTGLRVGELVTLVPGDVKLFENSGEILVRSEVSKSGRERTVPIPREAYPALSAHLADNLESDWLFMGREGPLRTETILVIVRKYAQWARLDKVTPQTLRHTFAYDYLTKHDNDLVALADVLGFTDLNTTRRYIQHALAE